MKPLFAGTNRDITEENLQSRTRGTILMAISNKFGLMVVTTGNKSEMSAGYATLYGDMNGGFNPIKDLYKTQVFRLCRLRNVWKPPGALGPDGVVIPERVITKPPTAELRENQKDQDTLPPYDVLDAILERLVEREEPIADIVAAGFDRDTVMRVDRMLNLAEYKRRQAAPGVKVTLRNFGRDRRYPIVNRFRDPGTPLPQPDATVSALAEGEERSVRFLGTSRGGMNVGPTERTVRLPGSVSAAAGGGVPAGAAVAGAALAGGGIRLLALRLALLRRRLRHLLGALFRHHDVARLDRLILAERVGPALTGPLAAAGGVELRAVLQGVRQRRVGLAADRGRLRDVFAGGR